MTNLHHLAAQAVRQALEAGRTVATAESWGIGNQEPDEERHQRDPDHGQDVGKVPDPGTAWAGGGGIGASHLSRLQSPTSAR